MIHEELVMFIEDTKNSITELHLQIRRQELIIQAIQEHLKDTEGKLETVAVRGRSNLRAIRIIEGIQ